MQNYNTIFANSGATTGYTTDLLAEWMDTLAIAIKSNNTQAALEAHNAIVSMLDDAYIAFV